MENHENVEPETRNHILKKLRKKKKQTRCSELNKAIRKI